MTPKVRCAPDAVPRDGAARARDGSMTPRSRPRTLVMNASYTLSGGKAPCRVLKGTLGYTS
jgi:hypothetical protein